MLYHFSFDVGVVVWTPKENLEKLLLQESNEDQMQENNSIESGWFLLLLFSFKSPDVFLLLFSCEGRPY